MLPTLMFNSIGMRYRTINECYSKPSAAKISAYNACVKEADELEEIFKPDFLVKSVHGISGFNCHLFTYTTDIYIQLPTATGPVGPGGAYVLVCRQTKTKVHTRYEFSHALYWLADEVKVRLFDIAERDIDYYYSYAEREAIRREVGESN